ncbi:MAG: hypothetical protein ABEJ99_00925 [Candidatus Nanohaloarchaea archaeon]
MTAMSDFLGKSAIALAALMLIGGASAASLSLEENDRVIWNSSDSSSERTLNVGLASCETTGTISVVQGDKVLVDNATAPVSENIAPGEVKALGEYTINGYCNGTKVSSESTDTPSVFLAEMNPEIIQPTYNQVAYRRYFMGSQDNGGLYKGKSVKLNLSIEGLSGFKGEGWEALNIDDRDLGFSPKKGGSIVIPSYGGGHLGPEPVPIQMDRNARGELESQIVKVHPEIPSSIKRGYKGIRVSMKYWGEEDSEYGSLSETAETGGEAIYLTGVTTESMQDSKIVSVPERNMAKPNIGGIKLRIFVENGFRKYVSAERFDLTVSGKTVDAEFKELEPVEGQKGLYTLRLKKTPSDLPDDRKFDIGVVYDDPLYSGNEPIEIASYTVFSDSALFRGYSWDSKRQPVKTVFRSDGREFKTDSEGWFFQRFDPGDYDFNITLSKNGQATLNLNDVQITPETTKGRTKIGYEYVNNPSEVSPPGIRPIDLVSFRFLESFKERGSTVTINYDVTDFDPTTVTVLACDNWNGGWNTQSSPECLSSWEKIEDTTFSPGWSVTVPVVSYESSALSQERVMRSAYVIGTRSGLRLNGPLTVKAGATGRVKSGGEITFQGQLVAGGSTGVGGANITVSMLEDGSAVKKFTGKTDGSGSFEISGNVPEEPGNYTLKLTANKPPYDSFSTTQDDEVWVFRERAIELTKKDSGRWKLEPGKETRKTVVVENTGQTAIEDITLEIADSENFNTAYLSLVTTDLGTIEPGEKKEAVLVFDIPSSCPGSGCSEFSSSIDLEASGTGASSELNVGPQISSGEDTGTKDSDQENKTGDGMSFSASDVPGASATGQFLAAQSTLNIALGLMFVFLMVLAGALKNKDGDDRNVRRNVVRGSSGGSSRPGVQPPRVSPAHEDSEQLDSPKTVDTNGGHQDESEEESREEPGEEESDDDRGKVEKLADSLTGSGDNSGDEETEQGSGEEESGDEGGKAECDVCGETFDTEAGVELHKQTAH